MIRRYAIELSVLLLLCGYAEGSNYPSLWECQDVKLQELLFSTLEEEFSDPFWQRIDRQEVAIALVDVTDEDQPRVAEINGNRMLYAASLPKIAILLGAFVEVERGNLELDKYLRDKLTRMIRYSSNQAASEVLRLVGIQNLADILRSERFHLYDPRHNGGLWVGKDYGGKLDWRRDPLNNISHGATAMQVARFYYLAFTGRLVAAELSDAFLEILIDPGIDTKFVRGLRRVNPDAEIYRKSGTWRNYHADSGVIVDDHYRYIVVALAKHPHGAQALVKLIGAVEHAMQSLHENTEFPIPKG